MGKKLAIKGHATRGNEVIELLEMLGGKNNCDCPADDLGLCYLIDDEFDICAHYFGYDDYEDGELNIFTLEEFLEKYPFKVGDKVVDCYGNPVTIKSMKLSDDFETMVYDFEETEDVLCAEDIESVNDIHTTKETITPAPDITANVTDKNNCDIQCPDGYEFYDENGNLIGTKVMMRPKKPKYPKTFKECRAILNYMEGNMSGYKASLFASLQDLLICRDAYWKIAGEQMGLDKPWDSEYGCTKWGYWIGYYIHTNEVICQDSRILMNHLLVFPTEEMRDAFYENFKDLIEECKELL